MLRPKACPQRSAGDTAASGGVFGQVMRQSQRGRWSRGGGNASLRTRSRQESGSSRPPPAASPPSIGVVTPRGSPRAGREGRREGARRRAGTRCRGDAGVSCGGGAERRRWSRSRACRAAPRPALGAWAAGPREQQRSEPPGQPRQVPAGTGSPARRAGGMPKFVPALPLPPAARGTRPRAGGAPRPKGAGSEPCPPGEARDGRESRGAVPHPRLGSAGPAPPALCGSCRSAGPQLVRGGLGAAEPPPGRVRAGRAAPLLLLPSASLCVSLLFYLSLCAGQPARAGGVRCRQSRGVLSGTSRDCRASVPRVKKEKTTNLWICLLIAEARAVAGIARMLLIAHILMRKTPKSCVNLRYF